MNLRGAPRSAVVALLGALLAMLVACGDDASVVAPSVQPTNGYVPTPLPSASATPVAGGPATPVPTVEGVAGEPVASTAALPLDRLPVAEFVTSGGATARLPIEVLPRDEFTVGLSGRRTLGERGMLFDYGAPGQEGPFWMKNTHFDLDIAFIDGGLRVVSIRTMRAETLDLVHSGAPYQYAIEAPAGWFAAHGVTEGARVRFLEPPSTAAR